MLDRVWLLLCTVLRLSPSLSTPLKSGQVPHYTDVNLVTVLFCNVAKYHTINFSKNSVDLRLVVFKKERVRNCSLHKESPAV